MLDPSRIASNRPSFNFVSIRNRIRSLCGDNPGILSDRVLRDYDFFAGWGEKLRVLGWCVI
jgi:hypothetical protein